MPQFTNSPIHKSTNSTLHAYRLYVLAAVLLADVAGDDRGIVFEENQILALDRLTEKGAFERQCVHWIQVVSHDPRLVDVCRGRNEIGGEDGGAGTRLNHDDLVMHGVAACPDDAYAGDDGAVFGDEIEYARRPEWS